VIAGYHADTVELGRMCSEAGVATLILTHLIPEPQSPEDSLLFEADVRQGGFTGRVVVGEDLHEHLL
jgi:ribonuclease Z